MILGKSCPRGFGFPGYNEGAETDPWLLSVFEQQKPEMGSQAEAESIMHGNAGLVAEMGQLVSLRPHCRASWSRAPIPALRGSLRTTQDWVWGVLGLWLSCSTSLWAPQRAPRRPSGDGAGGMRAWLMGGSAGVVWPSRCGQAGTIWGDRAEAGRDLK